MYIIVSILITAIFYGCSMLFPSPPGVGYLISSFIPLGFLCQWMSNKSRY